ncbi:MAG: ERCC4 domain-containing protein [Ruminococcus sp.]|nr:ERCC4 domain-containing protein [Ruminococcus sp.]
MEAYELDTAMKSMQVVVDTREKKNSHITALLDERKCPYKAQKLDYGDYTCTYADGENNAVSIENIAVIERKASLDELAGNITKGRERFEREFLRAKGAGAKVFLMIEGGSWDAIQEHRYRSQMSPRAFLNTLFSWQQKYNITISFVSKRFAGDYVYATLFMALKNFLLNGRK